MVSHMPWVVKVPLQSTVAWAPTGDSCVSVVPNRLSCEFFSFEVLWILTPSLLFGQFILLVTLFSPMTAKRWMASFLALSPGEWVEFFWCLVHGWSSSVWLWLDAGGALPTLSWNGVRWPKCLLDKQAPGRCVLSHTSTSTPPGLTQLSSCPWLWHQVPSWF